MGADQPMTLPDGTTHLSGEVHKIYENPADSEAPFNQCVISTAEGRVFLIDEGIYWSTDPSQPLHEMYESEVSAFVDGLERIR